MTIIHNVVHEALLIKSIKKRPGASKEVIIHDDKRNLSEFRSPEGHQRVTLRYSAEGTRQDQVLPRHAKSHVTSRKGTLLAIYNSINRGGQRQYNFIFRVPI